jgi:NAD(P)-dependent dehydrogenase (short-subunit alcohol dehydrogenase family)
MRQFKGKIAVITGAGSGIGRALALELGRAGCRLALSDVSETGLKGTVAACEALGIEARGYPLDVSKREAVYAHAEDVKRDFGNANLVINNAGVSVAALAHETSWADFEWLMGINFWGVTYGSQAFLPQLIASGDGHLVNISSVFGLISAPGNSAYNAAKFGVRGYTECLRLEMMMAGHPVQVSCVHPGGIRTNIARTARKGESNKERDLGTEFEKLARTTPEQAAAIILKGIRANNPRILVGGDAKIIGAIARLFGIGYQPMIARFMRGKM